MKKLLLPGIKRIRRTEPLMITILTILALLTSGLPSVDCYCCSAANQINGNVMSAENVAQNCSQCTSLGQNSTKYSSQKSNRDAGHSCCGQLKHSFNCHPVSMFTAGLKIESVTEVAADSLPAKLSFCDQFRRSRLGAAFYFSLVPWRAPVTILLNRLRL